MFAQGKEGFVLAARPHLDVENVEIVFKDGVGFDSQKLLDSVRVRYGQY